jgi:DNA mismatch repair protein MutS
LFATHFHELTQLRNAYPRLVNLKITIKEWESGIVFLRKIVPGTSDRSFGIHAAKVAGLPPLVLKRAGEILESLELRRNLLRKGLDIDGPKDQYSLFRSTPTSDGENDSAPPAGKDKIREALAKFDVDDSTPLDALQFVKHLKDLANPDDN